MVEGKTKTGFKYSVDEDVLDDAELLEQLVSIQEDGLGLFKVMEKMLGKEQKAALYEHCRNKKGKVSIESVGNELNDIFTDLSEKSAEVKNS
jgi:hypothetical protein